MSVGTPDAGMLADLRLGAVEGFIARATKQPGRIAHQRHRLRIILVEAHQDLAGRRTLGPLDAE